MDRYDWYWILVFVVVGVMCFIGIFQYSKVMALRTINAVIQEHDGNAHVQAFEDSRRGAGSLSVDKMVDAGGQQDD